MFLQLLKATPNSMLRASAQQLLDKSLTIFGTVPWILNTRVDNFLVNCKWILGVLAKWQFAT
jgi:hypothetical protein